MPHPKPYNAVFLSCFDGGKVETPHATNLDVGGSMEAYSSMPGGKNNTTLNVASLVIHDKVMIPIHPLRVSLIDLLSRLATI